MSQELRNKIINDFEETLQKFKNNELTRAQELRFTEFFLEKKYYEHFNNENDDDNDNVIKYVAMGYFVYSMIEDSLKNKEGQEP